MSFVVMVICALALTIIIFGDKKELERKVEHYYDDHPLMKCQEEFIMAHRRYLGLLRTAPISDSMIQDAMYYTGMELLNNGYLPSVGNMLGRDHIKQNTSVLGTKSTNYVRIKNMVGNFFIYSIKSENFYDVTATNRACFEQWKQDTISNFKLARMGDESFGGYEESRIFTTRSVDPERDDWDIYCAAKLEELKELLEDFDDWFENERPYFNRQNTSFANGRAYQADLYK